MDLLRKDKKISSDELISFVKDCSDIYIYGIGKVGTKIANTLKENGLAWKAFIISDKSDKECGFMNHPLYSVSEIRTKETDGIILAIAEKNQYQLTENLKEYGCNAKVYKQRLYSRTLKVPENYLSGADKDKGFFGKFSALNQLGVDFDTDKQHKGHDYLRKYELFLQYWKDKEFTLLELGVFHGGSLATWGGFKASKGYFTKARVVGVDINTDCKQYVSDQEVLIKDLGDNAQLKELKKLEPSIIIDDASHFCSHQIMALFTLWEALPSGGIYIMEDVDTSFTHIGYAGFDDAVITAYDVCRRIAEAVTSGGPVQNAILFQEDIERIALQVDMISFIHGSCIMIKK